jgi:hypothetical protein
MYCNSSGGACFFFDIDVKGGESVVISRMLQWYSCMFFKGLPSMPKGEIVGMFFRQRQSMQCLSLMANLSTISSVAIMARSTV